MGGIEDIFAKVFSWYTATVSNLPWLEEALGMSLLFFGIVQVVCAVGLFCIFARMNAKRWPAVVPVSGIYWLGELIQRRVAAVFIVFAKLLILLSCMEYILVFYRELDMSSPLSLRLLSADSVVIGPCIVAAGAAFLIRFIAGLFLYGHLCGKYGVSKWWLVPFSLVPYSTMLFWSMNSRVRDQF